MIIDHDVIEDKIYRLKNKIKIHYLKQISMLNIYTFLDEIWYRDIYIIEVRLRVTLYYAWIFINELINKTYKFNFCCKILQ